MNFNISIINGPNLNLLGIREPDVYGNETFSSFFQSLQLKYPQVSLKYYQSNIEGELINFLHDVGFTASGIIFNPGGYTHTSVALRDAIAAINSPVIEVHISNIAAREEFRQVSLLAPKCVGSISGLGLKGYELALQYFLLH